MIKSISFLITPEQREHITASSGKFMLERRDSRGRVKQTKWFTAEGFVNFVKNRDPFITLSSGEKLRVYRGGNSTDEVIETMGVVETHDNYFKSKGQLDFNDYYDW
jgi:hypothetical protein